MDPNTALQEIRDILNQAINGETIDPDDVSRAAELFSGLDMWIGKGGFLPADWDNNNR